MYPKSQKNQKERKSDYSTLTDEELNIQLQHAIENENYEEASVIKKELDGRKKS